MPPTLTQVFREQLAQPAPEPPSDGPAPDDAPRGWTVTTGITDLLEPFVTHVPSDADGLARYRGLTGDAAHAVLARLPLSELADRQNDAPTLGALLRAAAAHPGSVEVHGYLVGPGRVDERLSAESLTVRAWPDLTVGDAHDPGCECEVLLERVRWLGVDDALGPPHEIRRVCGVGPSDEPGWLLWWD